MAISGAQGLAMLLLLLAWVVTLMFAIPWVQTLGGDTVRAKIVSVGVVRASARVREVDSRGRPTGPEVPLHASIHGRLHRLHTGDVLEVRIDPARRIAIAAGWRGSGGFLLMLPVALVGTPLLVRSIRASRAEEPGDIDSRP